MAAAQVSAVTGAPQRKRARGLLGVHVDPPGRARRSQDAPGCEGGARRDARLETFAPHALNQGARVSPADFKRFAEANPDFAEEYLYPEQTRPRSCARTPPAPTPNGVCADFSPENSATGTEPVRKKLD